MVKVDTTASPMWNGPTDDDDDDDDGDNEDDDQDGQSGLRWLSSDNFQWSHR